MRIYPVSHCLWKRWILTVSNFFLISVPSLTFRVWLCSLGRDPDFCKPVGEISSCCQSVVCRDRYPGYQHLGFSRPQLLVQVRPISVKFNIWIKIRNLTAPASNDGQL